MSASNPTSPKVIASAAGAGVGATVSTLIVWLLGVVVWKQPMTAAAVNDAVTAVPSPVAGLILLLLTAASAAVPGYRVTDPLRVTTEELQALEALRSDQSPPPGAAADSPLGPPSG
jgi:hypothetical protein